MNELIVTSEEAGLLPEHFLEQRIPAAPRSYLRQLLKSGKIRGSSGVLCTTTPLVAGERVFLPESERLRKLASQTIDMPLIVLHETDRFLLVDKPAGLATHASMGHQLDNLTSRVAQHLKTRGERFMVAPIQRLDLKTSGVILFGKGRKACSVLGQMMMTQAVSKTYLALVSGVLAEHGYLHSEVPSKGKHKMAETTYQRLSGNAFASLLRITLHTGRQHQIRRQFSDIGHPLFGDRRYQGPAMAPLQRLFLHCSQLDFLDPFSRQHLSVHSALPAELRAVLSRLGFSDQAS
jgi:23S rRNA pseudouridine955/2504/2580 synthase